MSKLGKRYISVYNNGDTAPMLHKKPFGVINDGFEQCIEVDLDYARPIDRPEDEHLERTFIEAFSRLQEIRPDIRAEDVLAKELTWLRSQLAGMRTVVEHAFAATDYMEHGDRYHSPFNALWNAVDDYRAAQSEEPLPESNEQLIPIEICEEDIELQAYPVHSQGGQHGTRTSTGVLAVHRPTNVAAISTDARSMQENRQLAIAKLCEVLRGTRVTPQTSRLLGMSS